jgi:multicomponent Na+:H+ antiporter subunit D
MLTAIVALIGAATAVGVLPWLHDVAAMAGTQDADRAGYLHDTLPAIAGPATPIPVIVEWTASGLLAGAITALLACGMAAAALWSRRLPSWPRPARQVLHALHRGHSGHLGDYVAWLLAGVAALAGLAWF